MRAGPSLDDTSGWNEIKPLIDYGRNGRFNVRGVKLFMDGRFKRMLVIRCADDPRCFGILGSFFAGTIFG